MTTPTLRPALRNAVLAAALAAATSLAACGQDSPEKLMEKAKASVSARDPKAAEIHLKNLLQKKPDDAEARAMLGGLYTAARDPRSAEKEWTRALELGLAPDRALPMLLEARVQVGDAKGALEAAGRWQASQPQPRAAVEYWRGRAHAALGQPKEAERAFREALSHDPEFHRAQVALIQQRAAGGDLVGASAAIGELLGKAPALPEALMLQAELQLARNQPAAARESLEKAIEADPESPVPRTRLVGLLLDTQELDAAEAAFAQLSRLAPSLPQTTLLKAQIDFRRNRLDVAETGVLNVLKVAPDHPPALALAASVSLARGSLQQAETFARQLVAQAPQAPAAQRLLATALLRRNDPDQALQVVRRAIERGARDPILYQIAGEAAMRRNDLPQATDYFQQAAKLDPKSAPSRTGLGLAQIAAGRSEAGFGSLESAAEIDPQSIQADLALISARLRAKQYDQALAAIDRLEKKQPGAALPHNLRGTVRLARGDAAGARTSFERAAAADPTFFPAVGNLAQLDLRERKPAEARKRLDAFVQANPKSVPAWIALAQLVASDADKRDEVIRILEQARTANPDSIEPALALARVRMGAGQPREAVPVLQQALAKHPDDRQLLDALGSAYLATDERQQAISAFEQLVRTDPKSPAVHVRMGEVKAALGDTAGATASFRQAAELDPKAIPPRIGIAAMLLKEGRKDEARGVAAALQKELPNSPAGLALEGDLLAADGRWGDAAGSYRKALAVERSTPLVVKLHQALSRADRTAEADAVLREAVNAAPADVPLRLYAGERAVAAQRWPAAVEHYEVALKTAPGNVLALNNLAWALKEVGNPLAAQVAEQALERAPNSPAVLDTLGVILSERGEHPRALELLKRATSMAPKAPLLRLHQAQALARSGDKAGARAIAESLLNEAPDGPHAKAARALLEAP